MVLGEWGKSPCYFLPDKNSPIQIKSRWPFSSAGHSPLTAEPRWDYCSSRSFSPRTFALHYFRPKSRLVTNHFFYLPKFAEVLAVTMSGEKRPAPEGFGTSHQLVVKRNKAAENAGTELVKGSSQNGALIQSVCANFALEAQRAFTEYNQLIRVYRFLAQVVWMLLSWSSRVRHCPICRHTRANRRNLQGHSGEVFAVRFDPTAQHMASGAMDRSICMFHLYSGTQPPTMILIEIS
jgi:hypothetical protein